MANMNDEFGVNSILLSIVIPVYNETRRIHNLKTIVDYCKGKSDQYEIIVVDDGSTDETVSRSVEILKFYKNSKVLKSDKNYGKGHAVAMGMKESSGRHHLFMDVDLSTPLEHIDEAIYLAQNYNVVAGTRKNGKAKLIKRQSWIRENMGKGFTLLSQIILSTWLS